MGLTGNTKAAIMIAVLALTGSATVACANKSVQGHGGISNVSVTGLPTPLSTPTPTPTPAAATGGGTTHTSPPTKPAAVSSSPYHLPHFHLAGNYTLSATGACYWDVNAANYLEIGAAFTLTYAGVVGSAVPFTLSDSVGSTATSRSPNPSPFNAAIVLDDATANQYIGHTVELTGTIKPSTSDDTNPNDNTVSLALHVPASGIPTHDQGAFSFACDLIPAVH